jgi:hypothetical protein
MKLFWRAVLTAYGNGQASTNPFMETVQVEIEADEVT